MTPEPIQATTPAPRAPAAPAAPQAREPQIPALPAEPGASTGATRIVIVDQQPVIAGGQGSGIAGTTASSQQPDIPPELANIIRESLQGAIPIFGIVLSMLAVMFIGFPLVRAYVRRQDRKLDAGLIKGADVLPQIKQLQESVDAMAVELERISEAQRFQAKLMADRPPAVLPAHEGPRA